MNWLKRLLDWSSENKYPDTIDPTEASIYAGNYRAQTGYSPFLSNGDSLIALFGFVIFFGAVVLCFFE